MSQSKVKEDKLEFDEFMKWHTGDKLSDKELIKIFRKLILDEGKSAPKPPSYNMSPDEERDMERRHKIRKDAGDKLKKSFDQEQREKWERQLKEEQMEMEIEERQRKRREQEPDEPKKKKPKKEQYGRKMMA